MASSLVRLTVLGAIAGVNAADGWWFKARADDNENNWRPARETVTDSLDPLGWTPKPTSAPNSNSNSNSNSSEKYALELRQNDDDNDNDDEDVGNDFPTICATRRVSGGGVLGPEENTITCGGGSFCTADDRAQRVGCCDEEDAGACAIPTTCVDLADLPFLRQRANSKTMFW